MILSSLFSAKYESLQVLWEGGECVLCRGWRADANGNRSAVLAVLPTAEHPPPSALDRLAHEYELKDELDSAWAVRPLELLRERGRTMLVLQDTGGEPLAGMLGAPMELGGFLRLAVGLAAALGKLHQRGLVHKDIKPANIIVNRASGEVRLTGFGIASRLPRERQAPEPPETIAGTLAYMAPEQTGRMNRSIDSRTDLYSLGVTLYQMLTGLLPFTASDPMEWIHCHIARKPMPPSDRLENVPVPVSQIIMRLLAKTAEERYQTASGVERDLRRCLADWEAHGRIDDFPLGQHDTPDRLLIPEKLYGRAREVESLLAAFDRVVNGGTPELVLVSGYSGIGKSSVVNELHKVLVPPRGLFASGKFDQYKRDIPYSTLVQAFQSLVRPLLGKGDAELAIWRDAFVEALEPNARLMTDLIPELKLIIGEPPPVPELEPQQARSRFQLVFRRFIGVFARPEHPLALFLDDLQWLDAATLDLLEHLATQPELRHLLLIGAYRDNEVTPTHPLIRRLTAIRLAGTPAQDIVLKPLGPDDVGELIADALRCESDNVAALARLVHDKTAGNPFFTIQFLSTLAEERVLAFDHGAARWSWDLEHIHAMSYTDNVVALLVAKLRRLPSQSQEALKRLSCLGNSAADATLALVHGASEASLDSALGEAARAGLVVRLENTYRFLHDRVQEAAYLLIPEELRGKAHLRIGRLLLAHTPPEKREEAIFDIVNQLNRGAGLISSLYELEQLAKLNLLAGKRARASAAYASALTYFVAAADLLPNDIWERRYELAFAIELHRAECEFLTGALAEADRRLARLSRNAASVVDRAAIARQRVELSTTLGQVDRAVEVCLEYLRNVGIAWSAHPTQEEVRREYDRIWHQIGDRSIEELSDLPPMNPECRATLEVLAAVASSAQWNDKNLRFLVIGRMANLSLEYGESDALCLSYAWLGAMLGPQSGDYRAGHRFGKLGLDLMERRGLDRFRARVYLVLACHISPWTEPLGVAHNLTQRALEAAYGLGDLTYAAYSLGNLVANLFAKGEALSAVQHQAEAALHFVRQAKFGLMGDIIMPQLQLVRTLLDLNPAFGRLDDSEFEEDRFERHLESDPRRAIAACWYWIRKVQARVFANDYTTAIAAAMQAERLIWVSPTYFELAEYHFYVALARAALCDAGLPMDRAQHLTALTAHLRQLENWAANCPETFENRAALVGAEIARLEGRELDAERLYERAIGSARENGFIQNEALAYELASRFYAARGFEKIARLYLQEARYSYHRWGAEGKVRQLEEMYPYLKTEEPAPGPTGTIATPVEHLDLATVIKVSQALSGEIVMEKLLDTLMRTAIAQAGAERGLLILSHATEPRIAAEAKTSGDAVSVETRDGPVTAAVLPESVLHYVLHTRESVIFDDAATQPSFAEDPYIRQRQARSILCLPLINRAKLIGVLYLENNLTQRAFAPARLTVLKLLASQAAIALENANLYRDLSEREAKINCLIESNIIGIFISRREGDIIEANDAFLKMVGYDRGDITAGLMRWTELTPPEWLEISSRAMETIGKTGAAQPYEKEYWRKDGSRVPVLIGSVRLFDQRRDYAVTFVLDLTERKRAEAAAHQSERRYREMQLELAHANRVDTMGQLTASIAHEISQPITGVSTTARAALRWLANEPPAFENARNSLERIARDADRASEVIDRIRTLVKKAPPRKESFDIGKAIEEVILLTRSEALKNQIAVKAQFENSLPLVQADRVQLQQVLLNLILNAIQALSADADRGRDLLITTARAESNGVLVAVADSGPGLDPAKLEHVFDPFYTTKPDGLGMGLSICRSIIEAHGGRLWADANEPRGAVFQFTVPAVEGM